MLCGESNARTEKREWARKECIEKKRMGGVDLTTTTKRIDGLTVLDTQTAFRYVLSFITSIYRD